jgi:hypothetical protein
MRNSKWCRLVTSANVPIQMGLPPALPGNLNIGEQGTLKLHGSGWIRSVRREVIEEGAQLSYSNLGILDEN